MTQVRFCPNQGVVVGGKYRTSPDRAEYEHPRIRSTVGCNHLICDRCGAVVRFGPPGLAAKDDAGPHLIELYEADDWTCLPFLAETYDNYRLWACRCTVWSENRQRSIFDPDPDPGVPTPYFPWRCGGHPTPSLPVEFNSGLSVSAETNFTELVAELLEGKPARELIHYSTPVDQCCWLYAYLLGLPEADRLTRALTAHLTADDTPAQHVARGVDFFCRFPRSSGVTELLKWAAMSPETIALRYPLPEHYQARPVLDVVGARLLSRVDRPDAGDRLAWALFQEALLTPASSLLQAVTGDIDLVARYRVKLETISKGPVRDDDMMLETFVELLEEAGEDQPGDWLRKGQLEDTLSSGDELIWLADHALAIEQAGGGRWKSVLEILVMADALRREELGHLVIIAASAYVHSGLIDHDAIRAFIDRHGGANNNPWAMPIIVALGDAPD